MELWLLELWLLEVVPLLVAEDGLPQLLRAAADTASPWASPEREWLLATPETHAP